MIKIEIDERKILAALFFIMMISFSVMGSIAAYEHGKTQQRYIVKEQPIVYNNYYPQDVVIQVNSTTDEQRIRFNGVEQK